MSIQSYDAVRLKFSPLTLSIATRNLVGSDPSGGGGLVGDVANRLADIMNTLDNLQLSWVGAASDEAQTFVDRWNTAMTDLFGTQADPGIGVFVRLAEGLGGATVNYTNAEHFVVQLFQQFTGTSSGNSGPQSVTNTAGSPDVTAITEQL